MRVYAHFVDSTNKDGETGLTVTVDVQRVTLADGTVTETVTGGSATEVGDGLYMYSLGDVDLTTYDYLAVFKTDSADVEQKEIPALQQEVDARVLRLLAAAITSIDTELSTNHGSGSWQSNSGAGSITFVYTLTSSEDGTAIADASVWVTSDSDGQTIVAQGTTNASGQVTFFLDAGTYYLWRYKSGWTFTNPDTEVVS